jgi:hydroxymethylglutaryl-CoA lyase
MAVDELVGNIATENLINFAEENNIELGLNMKKFNDALEYSAKVF